MNKFCPACGSNDIEKLDFGIKASRKTNQWMHCRTCGSYFIDDEYKVENESVHTKFKAWGNAKEAVILNDFKERLFKSALKKINEYNNNYKTLIDIGASFGGFTFRAEKAGFEVTATDIVEEAMQYVSERGIKGYVTPTICSLRGKEKFDVAVALDCNIYFPDQHNELKCIYDVINDGGLFVIRAVNKAWMLKTGIGIRKILPGLGQKIINRSVNDHRFSMPSKSLIKLLKETGFKILDVSFSEAVHSDETESSVKFNFYLGELLYKMFKLHLGPGVLITCRK